MKALKTIVIVALAACLAPLSAAARDIEYQDVEVPVYVNPAEPTQVQFQGKIAGGFKRKGSALSLDRKDTDLIIFAQEGIPDTGEAIIVRLEDGRSYSLRVNRASESSPRDTMVRMIDKRQSITEGSEEEEPAHRRKKYEKAPPTAVAGLMREMVLVAEFGKKAVPGYRISDRFSGQTVLNDGTLHATIDRIVIGPNLWGYVLDAKNLLDQSQKLNPASFRLHGTRAVSMQLMELAPRPMNVEQQIASKHQSKVYIVTKAR